jgi:hypothetical protein
MRTEQAIFEARKMAGCPTENLNAAGIAMLHNCR